MRVDLVSRGGPSARSVLVAVVREGVSKVPMEVTSGGNTVTNETT